MENIQPRDAFTATIRRTPDSARPHVSNEYYETNKIYATIACRSPTRNYRSIFTVAVVRSSTCLDPASCETGPAKFRESRNSVRSRKLSGWHSFAVPTSGERRGDRATAISDTPVAIFCSPVSPHPPTPSVVHSARAHGRRGKGEGGKAGATGGGDACRTLVAKVRVVLATRGRAVRDRPRERERERERENERAGGGGRQNKPGPRCFRRDAAQHGG